MTRVEGSLIAMTEWAGFLSTGPLIAWLVVAALSCFGVAYSRWGLGRPVPQRRLPSAVVIIPVRGGRPLVALLRSLRAQIGVEFRVIFAVETEADAVSAGLRMHVEDGPEHKIVVAGRAANDIGHKIHNQLFALQHMEPKDEVVVFADCDIVPRCDWLSRLIAPLDDPAHGAVTGYRWLIPKDRRLGSLLTCLANNSIATTPPSVHYNIAWGGSTALRRDTLDGLRIKDWWRGAVSDDLQLTRALWNQGRRILGSRDLLAASPVSYSWREAIEFGRRQYTLVRIHMPRYWAIAAAATSLPLLGWATAVPLALMGNRFAIATIVLANALDHLRAIFRASIYRRLFRTPIDRRLKLLDQWATPLWLMFHTVIVWSTLRKRTFSWAGRDYEIRNPQSIEVKVHDLPQR